MELDEYLPVLEKTNARFADAAAEAVLAHGWAAPGARLPGLDAGRPRLAPGRGAALLGLGGAHPGAGPVGLRRAAPGIRTTSCSAALAAQHAELETALAGADPAERVWTWAPQQDVAFVLRRQVQEAVVHTVDVEQVLGDVRPIPTDVGLDGLDEWLEVMVPGALPDGPPADAHPVVLHAVDADAERTLFPGTPAVPDRRAHRHRRRPAARGLAAGAAGGAHRGRRRAAGRRDDRPRSSWSSSALDERGQPVQRHPPARARCPPVPPRSGRPRGRR